MKITIDSKIRIPTKGLDKELLKEIKEMLTYSNSKYHKLKAMRKSTKGVQQVIRSYTLEKDHIAISRGAFHRVKKILIEGGNVLQIDDKRILKPYKGYVSKINLRAYQKVCVKQGVHFQNCLIQGGCGSGKTIILLQILTELGQYTLIVVPTQTLQKQWIERIEFFLGIPKKEIGIWGGGKKVIKPITVGIVNSVMKDSKFLSDKFGAVLVDEVHRSPANMFQEFLDSSRAFFRIGATATPYRKDNLQSLMYDQFGKIVYKIEKEVLKRDKILMDVEFIVIPTDFEFPEYNPTDGENENSKNYNELLGKMINDEGRNALIYNYVKKEYDDNHVMIILSDRLQFCTEWKTKLNESGMTAQLMIGGKKNEKETDKTIEMLSNREIRIGLGTSVADEGLDIPVLDRGFITVPTASNRRRIEQQVGRLERRADGKTDAKMYYFWDWKIAGMAKHIKELAKRFPEGKVLWKDELISILEMKKIVDRGFEDGNEKKEIKKDKKNRQSKKTK